MAKSKTKRSESSIEIEGVGPIGEFSVPILPAGGIMELNGGQGKGKSIALAAINLAVTGKGKVPIQDGLKAARVEAFGLNMRIGAKVTRGGDSVAVGLEGKFSIGDLVDPGIANAESADAKRIKALIQLAGVEADISAFDVEDADAAEAIEFAPATREAADLVTMAERVKREYDAAARKSEDLAENCRGRVQALRGAIQAVDKRLPVEEVTAASAQKALEDAIAHQASVRAKREEDRKRWAAAREARANLERAKAERQGRTASEADREVRRARDEFDRRQGVVAEIRKKIADLQEALRGAEEELRDGGRDLEIAEAAEKATKAHFRLVAEWEAAIAAGETEDDDPGDMLIQGAADGVDAARQIVADVALRDQLENQREEMEAQAIAASRAAKVAQALRDAAKRTDEVLSDAVKGLGTSLYVEGGRLMIDTDDRGPTMFAELSDGERWKIALSIAFSEAAKLADDDHLAVMVIPQAAWGELQPANRLWAAAECRRLGVMAYTALATDDPELKAVEV